jgi:hypothetical protein
MSLSGFILIPFWVLVLCMEVSSLVAHSPTEGRAESFKSVAASKTAAMHIVDWWFLLGCKFLKQLSKYPWVQLLAHTLRSCPSLGKTAELPVLVCIPPVCIPPVVDKNFWCNCCFSFCCYYYILGILIDCSAIIFFETGSPYATQTGFELMTLLLWSPECWDYRCAPSHSANYHCFPPDSCCAALLPCCFAIYVSSLLRSLFISLPILSWVVEFLKIYFTHFLNIFSQPVAFFFLVVLDFWTQGLKFKRLPGRYFTI